MPMQSVQHIYQVLSRARFSVENEKETQRQIQLVLDANLIPYQREKYLDKESIIDFIVQNVGIEVKIKGRQKDIYKQLERYSKFKEINHLILLTGRSTGMVTEINGKRIFVINISKAWL